MNIVNMSVELYLKGEYISNFMIGGESGLRATSNGI